MKKYEIIDIVIAQDNEFCHEYLSHFVLKSEEGLLVNVDLQSSKWFDKYVGNLTDDEQIKWAREQKGKVIKLGKLKASA